MAPRIRRKKCSFINCENDSKNQPDLKYFHFPRSNYQDWIIASGNETLSAISETNICQHYYVCSEHFQMTDYKRILPSFETKVLLKNGVVPLPYNHRNLSVEGDGQPEMEEKKDSKSFKRPQKRKKKCAFVNCGNDSENHPEIKFYRFPHSNYKEWIEASGCHKLNTLTKINILSNYYVCSNHFRLTDCKKILPPSKKHFPLKSGVVPLFFCDENSSMKAEKSDVQSSPEKVGTSHSTSKKAKTPRSASKKAKTPCPASKKFRTSQSSTYGTPSICLPGLSPTSQTAAESTSQTSQSRTNTSCHNSSHQHEDGLSTNDSAGVLLREIKREISEETLPDLRPDQTQVTALCPQEQNNNQNCIHSSQFSAANEPTLTPLLSEVGDEKSCTKGAASSDEEVDEFFGGDEVFFESFADEEESQMYIDDYKSHDKTDGSAIERRTYKCSKQGNKAESSSKEKVQMHHGSEFEPDDREVASDASTREFDEKYSPVSNPSLCDKEGTSSSQSTKVVEDNSVNSKDSAGEGSILSSTSSVGAAGEGGSEKLEVIVTAGAKAGLTTSSVVSAASTTIITAGKGCTTVAKINTGQSLLPASPTTTEAQLFFRLPNGHTIPVKVPVAALMSTSTMPSPSPLCLPPPVQQGVELPQQVSSTLSVADVPPARDPLTGHQPAPPPAASESDALEGPTDDCSSKPQKGKKRKKYVLASPSEGNEETEKMKDVEKKLATAEKRRRSRQKKKEINLGIAPQSAELATVNSKLESEVASLKAEMTSLKDLLLQHMACPAPLAPTVRGANPVVVAAANPVVGNNPFVVAAPNSVVVAAEGPKVAAVPVPAMRPGQSSDAKRPLKPRSRTILPSTSKPPPAAFLLFTMQRKAAT